MISTFLEEEPEITEMLQAFLLKLSKDNMMQKTSENHL